MLYSVNLLPIERLSLLRIGIEKDYSAEPPGVPSSLLLSGEMKETGQLFIPGILLLLCPQCNCICG